MSDYGSNFRRCESCGHWAVVGQTHSCDPDIGELCNAIDIDNCAEHGRSSGGRKA